MLEEWSKFERSFPQNNTRPASTLQSERQLHTSHIISVQYMLKQRAKSTGIKTKDRSKATMENNTVASKKVLIKSNNSSTAARTCSQCSEKKSNDEFSSNQWHKGIAGRCQTCTYKNQQPAIRSIFKAALEDRFRALLLSHLCDASNWICSQAIVTYVGLCSDGVTLNTGNFNIQLSAGGTLLYLARKKTLRLVAKSSSCTIKICIFGTKKPGTCSPPKYMYALFKQGRNLLQFSPEDHLQSVIESNEYYPEDCHYC